MPRTRYSYVYFSKHYMHVVIGVSASSGYAVSICFTSLSDSFSNRVNDVDVSVAGLGRGQT